MSNMGGGDLTILVNVCIAAYLLSLLQETAELEEPSQTSMGQLKTTRWGSWLERTATFELYPPADRSKWWCYDVKTKRWSIEENVWETLTRQLPRKYWRGFRSLKCSPTSWRNWQLFLQLWPGCSESPPQFCNNDRAGSYTRTTHAIISPNNAAVHSLLLNIGQGSRWCVWQRVDDVCWRHW